jgi:ribosome-associated protein
MPEHSNDNDDPTLDDLPPSKSEMKRRMLALQELGETLVKLNDKQLQQMPVTDERLLRAIRETRQIRSNSARRRHMQFIGKLMRDLDATPIERALQQLHQSRQQENDAFHQLEELRDDMLAAGIAGVELAMQRWPQADRQHLRQLLLQHQREAKQHKPPAASRKLFRYLREQQENYGGEDSNA